MVDGFLRRYLFGSKISFRFKSMACRTRELACDEDGIRTFSGVFRQRKEILKEFMVAEVGFGVFDSREFDGLL